jgi:hypothetical protein
MNNMDVKIVIPPEQTSGCQPLLNSSLRYSNIIGLPIVEDAKSYMTFHFHGVFGIRLHALKKWGNLAWFSNTTKPLCLMVNSNKKVSI